jgi:hypothetical protein
LFFGGPHLKWCVGAALNRQILLHELIFRLPTSWLFSHRTPREPTTRLTDSSESSEHAETR